MGGHTNSAAEQFLFALELLERIRVTCDPHLAVLQVMKVVK